MVSVAFICTKFKNNLIKSEYQTNCKHSILLLYGALPFDKAKTTISYKKNNKKQQKPSCRAKCKIDKTMALQLLIYN